MVASVCFGGSRSLSSSFAPLVRSVVRSLGAAGVSVGCARGADELVLSAALADRLPLRVAAVGAADGAGFWSGSAPFSLLRSAARAPGCFVAWLAGGDLRVPLRGRLISRSAFALEGCSGFVVFLASPDSPGSLAVAALAVGRGLPVSAFCCGFDGPPASPRGCAGVWCRAVVADRAAWRWVPEGAQLPLF